MAGGRSLTVKPPPATVFAVSVADVPLPLVTVRVIFTGTPAGAAPPFRLRVPLSVTLVPALTLALPVRVIALDLRALCFRIVIDSAGSVIPLASAAAVDDPGTILLFVAFCLPAL